MGAQKDSCLILENYTKSANIKLFALSETKIDVTRHEMKLTKTDHAKPIKAVQY